MIKQLKKRLFDSPLLFLLVVVLFLSGLLVAATFLDHPSVLFLFGVALLVLAGWSAGFFFLKRRMASFRLQKEELQESANILEAEMANDWQLIESHCKKILSYSQLKGLTEKLCGSLSLQDTTLILSNEVRLIFGEKEVMVILYLFHPRTGSASHEGQLQVNIKEKRGDVYDEWVVKNLRPLLIEDTKTDFRFDAERKRQERAKTVCSLMSVPLMIGNKAIGILRVDSAQPGLFSSDDIRLLDTIAEVGAVAIENAQLYEKIEDMAIHDSLTGLFLRRYLQERLSQEISRNMRLHQPLCCLMIDLDHFKTYNDRYGHPAGDIVLKTVGRILAESFKDPGNFVCRYGGEEFAVIIPGCSKERGLALAEELRQKIAVEPMTLRRQETRVTVSVGVAAFPVDAQVKEDLIAKADLAMYQAKHEGRNRVAGASAL